ncbi:hypothetical protein [Kitasatospora sp. NE20-6]|uniref:hypothetical protein n=1 Tax=Kitasatospora sp. NE20-6 TaxID=2859066 RepID=UPI0038B30852
MSDEPWTIERISRALGTPVLTARFLGEINRAPAGDLLTVFAHWQAVAESLQDGARRGRDLAARAGEPDGGEWADITDTVKADAERIRHRAA